jgi:hypothetical protein
VKALTIERVAEAEKLVIGAVSENKLEKPRQSSEYKTNIAYLPVVYSNLELEESTS